VFQIFNGLGLLVVSMHPRLGSHRFAGPAIALGTVLFSGSIMALVLTKDLKFLGPVTPLGGIIMIAGYDHFFAWFLHWQTYNLVISQLCLPCFLVIKLYPINFAQRVISN
jgi:uncharacterized membrane protein YgdD (TMEM256/DUF423 family)